MAAALPVPVVGNQSKPLWLCSLSPTTAISADATPAALLWLKIILMLVKAVPGSDSKMSQLTDGSLVVVVILDVQMPAGDRERRVILVEAGRTLFRASCVRARRRNEGQGELDRADRRLVDSGKERKLRGQLDNHHHPTYTHILLGSF